MGQGQRLDGLKLAGSPCLGAQGHGAAAFERENEVVAQCPHQAHVLGRGIPATGQQVAVATCCWATRSICCPYSFLVKAL